MVSLEDSVIARFETGGNRFEILVDPKAAQEYNEGKDIDWEDAIAADGVWNDSSKGERAPDILVNNTFGSLELIEIYKKILEEGNIQLTSQQRKEMVEQKRKRIVAHIVANAMNPQTGGAHPPQRIENAIEEVRYSVDPMETVEKQVVNIVKKIKTLIPISFEKIRVAVRIQAIYVGKCYGQLTGIGKIENEEYQKDGSWVGIMEMSAASYNRLEDVLGSMTKGTAETKVL
ncbi:MAG: ribosome assembly factor SBDS [Candidatus Marinimicrobia bacterium]|jgi:ribosome maturation protein SDO1|nr:ribosome assembly factor SBDS [Candidatus Neomarinimicrobiota bacterium]MCS5648593.1 ribosome assembly factor SBDS [Dehalococcoidia bacterium]|tara:strand:+ start:28 stop:720 length:693 start_codon:yes stop_codon:yes gene_type:complete